MLSSLLGSGDQEWRASQSPRPDGGEPVTNKCAFTRLALCLGNLGVGLTNISKHIPRWGSPNSSWNSSLEELLETRTMVPVSLSYRLDSTQMASINLGCQLTNWRDYLVGSHH